MEDQFYRQIFDKHQLIEPVPSNKEITAWALQVIRLIVSRTVAARCLPVLQELKEEFSKLENGARPDNERYQSLPGL